MADAKWIFVKKVSQPSGTILANEDQTTRSLNPAHDPSGPAPWGPYHWESRPPGSDGGYERCTPGGGTVAYNPTGKELVVFGWKDEVPNKPGFSAMTEAPIQIETVPL